MLINADAKALEVLCAAFLSQDKILCEETIAGIDMHTVNQQVFGLPSRGIAKILVFRILYGGTEFSFARDPEFAEVSTSEKFWKGKIDKFYEKYQGLAKWHADIIREATKTGFVQGPFGRKWPFSPDHKGNWPVTKIKNFIVQGTGADLMCIVRVSFARRFLQSDIKGKLISTVHDSIVVDVENSEVDKTCRMFHEVFDDVPKNIERLFGCKFDLPSRCEVEFGPNLKDTQVWVPS